MPPSEIRKEAREALKGKWGKAVGIILAYMLFTFVLGLVEGLFLKNKVLFLLIELAILLISMPLSFGLLISFMKLKRDENVGAFGFIKDGFSHFGKAWGIAWHTFIRMLLPAICLILVAMLLSFSIGFGAASGNYILAIVIVVLYIATLIYVVSIALLYTVAYNVGYDNPELSSKACVKKSEELMKGNRGSYFLLQLYFICLVICIYLASIVISFLISSSVIGALLSALFMIVIVLGTIFYITPYMQVATVCFYDRLAKPEVKTVEGESTIEE